MPDFRLTFRKDIYDTKTPDDKCQFQADIAKLAADTVGSKRSAIRVIFHGILAEDVVQTDDGGIRKEFFAEMDLPTFTGKTKDQILNLGRGIITEIAKFVGCNREQVNDIRVIGIDREHWIKPTD